MLAEVDDLYLWVVLCHMCMFEKNNCKARDQWSRDLSKTAASEMPSEQVWETRNSTETLYQHSHRRVCVSRTSTWDGSITSAAAQDRGRGTNYGDNCASRWVQSWRKCRFLEQRLNKLLLTDDDYGEGRRWQLCQVGLAAAQQWLGS